MPDLPKITERFLMTRRRSRPYFSPREMEDFLGYLRRTRELALKFQEAQDYGSESRQKAEAFHKAIDDFAEVLTGDREYFWQPVTSYPSG